MNKKVYLVSAFLILIAILLITARIIYGGQKVELAVEQQLWHVNIIMEGTGTGAKARIKLTLPRDTERQTIYNENFENDEMSFSVRETKILGNRIGTWQTELLDGTKSIRYTFSVRSKSIYYPIPQDVKIPKNPYERYPEEFHKWLDPSKYIQSEDVSIKEYLSKIAGREKNAARFTSKIFDFVRGSVKYKSEKGSKDAKATLEKLTADCGGQARLFVALSRAGGIPSRLVGGIALSPGVKKITHVWAENYIGGRWIPFDAVNNYYGFIPKDYLELYRGDYSLIKHVGFSSFNYFFVIGRERIPPVDQPWSLYALPLHSQNLVNVLLLIPLGALVVAFMRIVIGVPTFGTFAPILLALAFREISLWAGIACVTFMVFFGCILRYLLDRLKILIIPRLSIIVTTVVIFVMLLMVAGFHAGQKQMLYASLFPIVIITWIIERFSVLQIEDGTPAALKAVAGTAFVAVSAYYLMEIRILKFYLFSFPEILLVIMALLLLLGRYTGLRVSELWRFKDLLRHGERKDQ